MRLWVYGDNPESDISWHNPLSRGEDPSALTMGSPLLASDTSFGAHTKVELLSPVDSPDAAAKAYTKLGTNGFGLLDGEFLLVLADRTSSSVFLVVDKVACNDIYIRRLEHGLLFSSDCASVMDSTTNWDPLAAAFFLGQHGFVPGPCTLSPSVETVARAGYLRISAGNSGLSVERGRYWRPSATWQLSSTNEAADEFFEAISAATAVRTPAKTGLLLSGGVDSSLLLNVAKRAAGPGADSLLTMTGAVTGFRSFEYEIRKAARLAAALNTPHAAITVDPNDDSLPDEWAACTTSMTGTRVQMPLFLRFGLQFRERYGDGFSVVSGQAADTLADNNYTLPSAGYTVRRALFSSWFSSLLPALRRLTPSSRGIIGQASTAVLARVNPRAAGMWNSILDGLSSAQRFYDGRVFGYGEMPGRGPAYYPVFRKTRFDEAADWYSQQFVRPAIADLTPADFYRNMIELNMDMVMLHLDSRPVFQVFRLTGGRALLPFLDARILNLFCSLPYSARAFYRKPKLVISEQFRRRGLTRVPSEKPGDSTGPEKSQEELLLQGSLGAGFRELLTAPTFPDRATGVFDFVDESYFNDQVRRFVRGSRDFHAGFIAKLAALEFWSRRMSNRKIGERQMAAGIAK